MACILDRAFANQPALVAFLTCGDPDLPTTREIILAAIRGGADVIELGVPFSDPLADGPVIQRASERALKHNTSLRDVIEVAASIRREDAPRCREVGLVIFSYLNPLVQMGLEKFAAAAAAAGVDGVLATDMPVEESAEYRATMQRHGLAPIFLVAPTSTDERLRKIASVARGFIYAVSRTGVTGERQQLPEDAQKLVKRLRKFTKLPIAVGFGISSGEQVKAITGFADAAVVGSAIVKMIEQNPGHEAAVVEEFVRALKGKC